MNAQTTGPYEDASDKGWVMVREVMVRGVMVMRGVMVRGVMVRGGW